MRSSGYACDFLPAESKFEFWMRLISRSVAASYMMDALGECPWPKLRFNSSNVECRADQSDAGQPWTM